MAYVLNNNEAVPERRQYNKLVDATLESIPITPRPAGGRGGTGLCLNKGYDYDDIRAPAAEGRLHGGYPGAGEEAQAIKREAGTGRGGGWWNGRIAG
jgi:hypothetical protein